MAALFHYTPFLGCCQVLPEILHLPGAIWEDGKTLDEIVAIGGYANDSLVRILLNENTSRNKNKAQAMAEIVKKELAEKGALDVGVGVERELGTSSGVLQEALFILETESYNRFGVGVPQVNDPQKWTITSVIYPFLKSTRRKSIRTLTL